MNNDDLDPIISDALRGVTPVDPTAKDLHIAQALSQVDTSTFVYSTVTQRQSTRRLIAIAAAAIVVISASFITGRTTASNPLEPVVTAPNSTIAKTALATCTDQFDSNAELVHTYEVNDIEFAIVNANGETFILEIASCTYITQFTPKID